MVFPLTGYLVSLSTNQSTMSGLLYPGSDGDRISRTVLENSGHSPETSNIMDRKLVFGTPTSQLSSNTDTSSQKATVDSKPRVSDVGMSPVRDSVGKLMHPRKDGARYSEDNVILHPDGLVQPDEQDVSLQGEEGKREGRWGSARARLGSVFSGRHSIRESVSRIRRKSVDPSHLMNDLCSESGSRADLRPSSAYGSGQQSLPPRDVAAITSTDNTFHGHVRQASDTTGGASPSRLSSKFTSWKKHNLSTPKGRGRELSQEEEGGNSDLAASEQLRSSSTPPPQKFKVRVNRFLRSGRRSVSSITGSPASGDTAPVPSTGRGNPDPLASVSNSQTPPYPSSAESSTARGTSRPGTGFRQAVRRGVSSARRRMSVPFLSTPPLSDDNASVSDAPAIEPPKRPQTVPLEQRGGVPRTPGGSQFVLSDEPGRAFLPSEAKNVIPPTTPPVTENPHAEDWLGGDFEHISMIQSRPPLPLPGMEESPPLSPWAKSSSEPQPWLKLTETPPRLPEIASVAPFVIGELIARDSATMKAPSSGQGLLDKYWTVASGSKDKGKERAKSNASDYLIPPPERNFYLESSGKSIEVLDEEKRRKSRDTGIIGLNPEVTPSEPLTTSRLGAKDDEGELTYAAAVREIAGLGRFPKRPPPDTGTDDVSVPMPECDYDLPLPNFRFSILSEPSSSSNEPDVSPCAASSSLAQETSGSISYFVTLAPTQTRISTTTTTTTTTRTATAASTNPSTSITSPSDYTPYNYQMLLSSKRPYLFVLQELSSGTYIKITPQKNSSPVSRSLSTLTPSYPETPLPSQTSPSDARSPVSVRFVNSNGLLIYDAQTYEEMDNDDDVDDEEEDKDEKRE